MRGTRKVQTKHLWNEGMFKKASHSTPLKTATWEVCPPETRQQVPTPPLGRVLGKCGRMGDRSAWG